MYVYKGYRDNDLQELLLEALYTFGPLDENHIDDIVAVFHYLGRVDAGEVRLTQGNPHSDKWRVNMIDLIKKRLVTVQDNGYQVFSLTTGSEPEMKSKFSDLVRRLRKMNGIERNNLAIKLHRLSVTNYHKSGELRVKQAPEELTISDVK